MPEADCSLMASTHLPRDILMVIAGMHDSLWDLYRDNAKRKVVQWLERCYPVHRGWECWRCGCHMARHQLEFIFLDDYYDCRCAGVCKCFAPFKCGACTNVG